MSVKDHSQQITAQDHPLNLHGRVKLKIWISQIVVQHINHHHTGSTITGSQQSCAAGLSCPHRESQLQMIVAAQEQHDIHHVWLQQPLCKIHHIRRWPKLASLNLDHGYSPQDHMYIAIPSRVTPVQAQSVWTGVTLCKVSLKLI